MLSVINVLPVLNRTTELFSKYVFGDWNALAFLMVIFLLDTVLGVCRSFKQGRFHSRGMRQMFRKMGEYAVGIIVAHVFCAIEIDGQKVSWVSDIAPSVKYIIYLAILIIETKSIDENLRGLGGNGLPLPPFFRRGMTDWEETGEFRSKVPPAPTDSITNPLSTESL